MRSCLLPTQQQYQATQHSDQRLSACKHQLPWRMQCGQDTAKLNVHPKNCPTSPLSTSPGLSDRIKRQYLIHETLAAICCNIAQHDKGQNCWRLHVCTNIHYWSPPLPYYGKEKRLRNKAPWYTVVHTGPQQGLVQGHCHAYQQALPNILCCVSSSNPERYRIVTCIVTCMQQTAQ